MQTRAWKAVLLSIPVVFVASAATAQVPPVPLVPVPPENPITEAKRVLGKILFWDEQLSSDHSTACGSCHLTEAGGSDVRLGVNPGSDEIFGTDDDVVGSPGVRRANAFNMHVLDPIFGLDVQVTGRSAPSFYGGLFSPELFWDGRAGTTFVDPQTGLESIGSGGALESQAVGPIVSDVEMAHEDRDWSRVAAELETATPLAMATNLPPDLEAALADGPGYPDLFESAFGDPGIDAERIAFAIATYERTLVADQTPWDRFRAGDASALSPAQQAGWNFFQGSRCSVCHRPPWFTDETFRNVGLRPPDEDLGRAGVTGLDADRGRFKVPTLRNVGLKPGFMHNGQLASLPEVLDFYQAINGQVQFPDNQDPLVRGGIPIARNVRGPLTDFLANGLTDPRAAAGEFPFDRPQLRGGQGICDDGLDNDGDRAVDLADPGCIEPSDTSEAHRACGLGFELAPLLLGAGLLARRRRGRPRAIPDRD